MASRPKRPCNYPGCPALITDGRYCPAHTAQAAREDAAMRGSASDRGYDGRWQEYSVYFRGRYPLCGDRPANATAEAAAAGYTLPPVEEFSRCKAAGLVRPAELVDHVFPVTGQAHPLFWLPWNHQGLCWSCHNLKTARERAGVSR